MGLAAGSPTPSAPKPPKRPRSLTSETLSSFNRWKKSTNKLPVPTRRVSTSPPVGTVNSSVSGRSYMRRAATPSRTRANLMRRTVPTSSFRIGSGALSAAGGINSTDSTLTNLNAVLSQIQNADRNEYEQELRAPMTMDSDSLAKRLANKISKRGGYGIFNPMIPIQGASMQDLNDFGVGTDPIHGGTRNHTGADMSAPMGTPIYATVGGTISNAANTGGAYGNQVVVDHGSGESSMYGHLSKFIVQPGQKVKKGDLIGYVGSTGRSTGPHLHWETWKDGQVMDPSTAFDRSIPDDVIRAAQEKFLRKHGHKAAQGAQEAGAQFPEYSSGSSGPPQGPQNNVSGSLEGQLNQLLGGESNQPTGGRLKAFLSAIAEQESGGDYSAVGVPTSSGTALGKYQILNSNINGPGGWDAEALGHEISGQEFLNSPRLQEQIARQKLKDYFKDYGPEGAAKAWYAGPGNATLNSDAPQYGGPSVNGYAESVLELMKRYM